jgi:putative transposase
MVVTLNWEGLCTLQEATVLIERWHRHYNTARSYSAIGDRPPAPQTPLS